MYDYLHPYSHSPYAEIEPQIVWVIGFLLAAGESYRIGGHLHALNLILRTAGLSYYTELLAIFPNRAGSDVAYLEQAYKKPKFLFVACAIIPVIHF